MNRRSALARLQKAAITTTSASESIVDPERSRSFLEKVKLRTNWGRGIRQELRTATSGTVDKITIGDRIIRRAVENDDDGYRAEPDFEGREYQTKKIRLPWEITRDTLRHNIEGQRLGARIVGLMARQWSRDLDDLELNGDEAAGAGVDQAFLRINNGLLAMAMAGGSGAHIIDGTAVAATFGKDQLFEMAKAMPPQYWSDMGEPAGEGSTGQEGFDLVFYAHPTRILRWHEYLTERPTAAGDAALGSGGTVKDRPLGIPFVPLPKLPETTMILAPPQAFIRVLTLNMVRYHVTPETDMELANRDKEGYVFFLEHDFVVDEFDAVVVCHSLPTAI